MLASAVAPTVEQPDLFMVLSSQPPRSAEFCRPQATVWNLWMPVSESEYKFFGIFLSECRPSLIDFSSGKGWKPKEDVADK